MLKPTLKQHPQNFAPPIQKTLQQSNREAGIPQKVGYPQHNPLPLGARRQISPTSRMRIPQRINCAIMRKPRRIIPMLRRKYWKILISALVYL